MRFAEQVTMTWSSGEDFPDYVEVVVNGRRRIYVDRQKVNQSWLNGLKAAEQVTP